MSTKNNTMSSNVETLDIDLDTIFNAAPSGADMTLPSGKDTKATNNIFSGINKKADFSFADPDAHDADDLTDKDKTPTSTGDLLADDEEENIEPKATKEDGKSILESLGDDEDDEEKKETRGRKPISGISDVFSKMIKEDKLVPFDDEKSFDEYTAKDWEELIEANLEEKANQVRRETPKQFFASLPEELQIAARYVADGGTDLKGLFSTLGQVEETKDLDIKSERDQEIIIKEYLSATGYGTSDEIAEEIEIWKDLGKLEQQASKFKPKLDKMAEQIVIRKVQEQQIKQKQQEQASKAYMQNVYDTLKDGNLGDIKVDRKTQAMLYNGLVQPSYPSVSGRNTNLLGHLLEKYQFVEPNYKLISEALWLLQDPEGYKAKIMDKGAQQSIEQTVRKLKTEQGNHSSSSLGIQDKDEETRRQPTKKLPRTNNIFKRI